MPLSLRTGYAGLVTSAGHLLILLVAAKINQPAAWLAAFALIAALSLAVWASAYRRARVIADTPTSRIASAAQGYAEIYGRASSGPEHLVQAKNGSLPCVWFHCVTYRRGSDNKWREISRQVSDTIFEVADGSGSCMVDPEHAEVITTHHRTWYEGDYKHVERQLFSGDSVYVLGEFATLGGAHTRLDVAADMRELLAEWKRDQPALLQRFDLDGDGAIDLQEWELARRAARREVERQHRELRLKSGVHVMRRPASGQLFLLSNLSPHQLKRRYQWWSIFHLATFFAASAAAAWMLLHHVTGGSPAALW